MPFLDDLRRSRESPASAFQSYLLQAAKFPGSIHAFFEGDSDSSFYTGFLHSFAGGRDVCPHRCGNKDGVYDTFHRVMTHKPPLGTPLFFVDKDLSDILSETRTSATNIYVTDYYSIENYLVTSDMLRRVLNEIFHFTGTAQDPGPIVEKFASGVEQFHASILPIMAWIVCLRYHGHRPNLNNVKLSRVFLINDELEIELTEEAHHRGELAMVEQMCGVSTPDICKDFSSIVTQLSGHAPKR